MSSPCGNFLDDLRGIVGRSHVLTAPSAARAYCAGYRIGRGEALAVVRPASLVELWQVARLCVAADAIIIVQAANTGLTGGSTPFGCYDRPVVLINTLRIDTVLPVGEGRQAICLAGATLSSLERELRKYGRTPHSVIGSSCIGASVVGGICNNSGGALVNRGPAFTRFSLFARVNEQGKLVLVNKLGFWEDRDPLAVLDALDRGNIPQEALTNDGEIAGLSDYSNHLRELSAPTPARYNADARCHLDAAGCAGKVIVFAVRVDSFAAPERTASFCLLSDDAEVLTQFRRDVLATFKHLPVSAEYLHCDAAAVSASHGNDICLAVRYLGADRMPMLLAAKRWLDRTLNRLGSFKRSPGDRLLHFVGSHAPHPLPRSIRDCIGTSRHLLLVTAADGCVDEMRAYLEHAARPQLTSRECKADEAAALQRLRFATAGAMVRFSDIEPAAGPLVALDYALPRNLVDWQVELPPHLAEQVLISATYSHFLCHVFHLDLVLRRGTEPVAFEDEVLKLLQELGAQCPAEHNFGHHYKAPDHVIDFYRKLDPTNSINPGIGQSSRAKFWR